MIDLRYRDDMSMKSNIKTLFNWCRFSVQEMTEGRVKAAQKDIASAKETEALTLELAADHEARLCEMELGVQ